MGFWHTRSCRISIVTCLIQAPAALGAGLGERLLMKLPAKGRAHREVLRQMAHATSEYATASFLPSRVKSPKASHFP